MRNATDSYKLELVVSKSSDKQSTLYRTTKNQQENSFFSDYPIISIFDIYEDGVALLHLRD